MDYFFKVIEILALSITELELLNKLFLFENLENIFIVLDT